MSDRAVISTNYLYCMSCLKMLETEIGPNLLTLNRFGPYVHILKEIYISESVSSINDLLLHIKVCHPIRICIHSEDNISTLQMIYPTIT